MGPIPLTFRNRCQLLWRTLRPYQAYGDFVMEDGRWYAIPPRVNHECCRCHLRHRVDIGFTGQAQPQWRWMKLPDVTLGPFRVERHMLVDLPLDAVQPGQEISQPSFNSVEIVRADRPEGLDGEEEQRQDDGSGGG